MNQQEEGGGTVAEGYREYTLMHKDIPVLTLTPQAEPDYKAHSMRSISPLPKSCLKNA